MFENLIWYPKDNLRSGLATKKAYARSKHRLTPFYFTTSVSPTPYLHLPPRLTYRSIIQPNHTALSCFIMAFNSSDLSQQSRSSLIKHIDAYNTLYRSITAIKDYMQSLRRNLNMDSDSKNEILYIEQGLFNNQRYLDREWEKIKVCQLGLLRYVCQPRATWYYQNLAI